MLTHLGSKGGAVVRALASHQCGRGSNPGVDTICGLSLLLVLSLAPRGFSPSTPVFTSPQKPTFPNSNSTRNQVDEEPLCGCTTCKSLFIYLFIYRLLIYAAANIQQNIKKNPCLTTPLRSQSIGHFRIAPNRLFFKARLREQG